MTTTPVILYGDGLALKTPDEVYAHIRSSNLITLDQAPRIVLTKPLGIYPDDVVPAAHDANRRFTIVPHDSLNINKTKPNVLDVTNADCILTLARRRYGSYIKTGVDFEDLPVLIGDLWQDPIHITGNSGGAPIDMQFRRCRFIETSTTSGHIFEMGVGRADGKPVFEKCFMVVAEGAAGRIIFYNKGDVPLNQFEAVCRGSAIGQTTLIIADYPGTVGKNLVLTGFAGIAGSNVTLQNVFSNLAPTSGQTAGVTVVGTNDLVENPASDGRIKLTSVAIGAAPADERYKLDILGNTTGEAPDVGPLQRLAGATETPPAPGTPTRTVRGQRVRAQVSFVGNASGGTAKMMATGGGGVTTETAATIDNTTKIATVEFTVATPGDYSGVTFTLSNTGGPATSVSSDPFTVGVPVVSTITFGPPIKSGASVTFRGTYTGFPTSGAVQMPAAAVSPGAAVTRANIPIVFADNGTWSAPSPTGALGKYDPATATATNMSGTGSATAPSGFTLYALGTTPVGTPAVELPAYSAPAFNSPAVAVNGKVTDVRFESTSGSVQTNVPFSFGQVFKESALAPGNFLTGKIAGQSDVPLQVNAMATHKNGSLKHAIISGVLPSLAANATVTMDLVRAASSTATTVATSSTALANAGFSVVAEMTIGGTLYTANVNADMLAGFAANKVWAGGSVMTEWEIKNVPIKDASNNVHPTLTAQITLQHFPGAGRAHGRIVIEHTKAYLATHHVTYDAVIKVAGATVYTKAGLLHYTLTRWNREFWWNGTPALHIKHNTAYLISTKAVPNYRQSLTFSETRLQEYGATDANTEPMTVGPFTPAMPATGARPDIGLLPEWAAATVVSMDKRAKNLTLASSGYGGSYPIHRRDHSGGPGTGYPISVVNFPNATFDGTISDSYNEATGQQEKFPGAEAVPYEPDDAHQPNFSYLPYLLTGDPFHLEELHFWVSYNTSKMNPSYRNFSDGSIVNQVQLRGQGWGLRTVAEAAYITPDNHPLKMHFKHFADNTIATQNARYTDNPNANKLGAGEGHLPYDLGGTVFTATANQTTFSVPYYPGYIIVVINGNGIADNQYTATNGTTITLNTPVAAGTQVVVVNKSTGIAPWMDDFLTSGAGHAADLGFTEAARLLLWKAKFPVNRMVGAGVCYINAAPYAMQVRDRHDTPFYETPAEAYQKTALSGGSQWLSSAMVGLECNSQAYLDVLNSIRPLPSEPYVLGEMAAYRGNTSYVANMQPALAYAVDSGYPGALEAWNLFKNRANPADYSVGNQFDIWPRTVEGEPQPGNGVPFFSGTIANITGTAGQAITPVNVSARFSDTDALTYSASPAGTAWPTGLIINASTGVISGTVASATTVTGLKVRATDTAAQTVDSNAFSATITAAAGVVPGVLTNVVATAGDEEITLNATLGSVGSSAITSFNIVLSTGGAFTRYTLPATVPAEGDVPVSAQIQAINAVGPGPLSAASNVVTPALIDNPENNDFTPSTSRMITVLPGRKEFDMGDFWTMGANGPEAEVDPDETLDIPFNWTPWLADIGGANLASAAFTLVGGVQKAGSGATTKIATVFFSATDQVGKTVAISCKIITATTPPRTVERTVYLKIKEQ